MKRAVVLMNLGSPDSTQVRDVRKYLDEFLMDEARDRQALAYPCLAGKSDHRSFTRARFRQSLQSIWTDQGSPLIVISRK
jgi:ferrochelatase